ncbi:MAG: quinolinate synthase NadA [Hyphomicrobiales bacterium]|nr:quinolinate synthase NadA [Hyphomicrobiales bacterium]
MARDMAPLYERVRRVVPEAQWMADAPYIHAINRLKRERNAVILAHNYQVPEIYHTVADVVGDSLYLAKQAALTEASIIVQGGVHFMAETSKLLCPDKQVLIPDSRAGCSLAESINAADVRALRAKHAGVPVVAYVNTSAAVKAEVDICCTSSNAVQVVESLGVPEVIFLPDQYLATNVAAQTKVKIISWAGACEVHERFTAVEIREYRAAHPGLEIIGHPECPPEVIAECDFSGSTAAMIKYVKERKPKQVLMVTECTMSDNVAAETPDVEFIRPCNLCPHMRRITLPAIFNSLQNLTEEVKIDPALAVRARASVQRMIDLK